MTLEKIMKHHTEGGRMIRHFNGKKEYILSEEDMNYIQELVKNCSIPDTVGQSKQLPRKSEHCVLIIPEPCKLKGVCEICS